MFSSPKQNNAASESCHQEVNRVNQWWIMDNVVNKTLPVQSSIIRSYRRVVIKGRHANFTLQSLQFVLNSTVSFISALTGACSNKSINVDRFYTPRRYRSALCKTVKLFQTLYC